jgi:hypothetical protein
MLLVSVRGGSWDEKAGGGRQEAETGDRRQEVGGGMSVTNLILAGQGLLLARFRLEVLLSCNKWQNYGL